MMELNEAIHLLETEGFLIEKKVPSNIILYHGTRNGDLKIDLKKENNIWLTPDLKMATEYAALKENNSSFYSLVTVFKKNSKRAVYKIRLKESVKLLDFTNKEEREAFVLWYINKYETEYSNKLFKDMCTELNRDYSRFAKYYVGYGINTTPIQGLNEIIKKYGYDGYISNEMGYYTPNGAICEGISYYIFNLNKLEVLDKVKLS